MIPTLLGKLVVDETIPQGLRWKVKQGKMLAGSPAGTLRQDGYYSVSSFGKKTLNHRLIFEMAHGYCPTVVDHIDGNPLNNSPSNLREAEHSENSANAKCHKDNQSGIKGIRKHGNRYEGRIMKKGTEYRISEETLELAVAALSALRKELHGEFAKE